MASRSGMAFRLTLVATQVAVAVALVACGPKCEAPAVTAQPTDQAVVANEAARFVVQASGDDLTYQWQRSTDGGSTWSDVSGATQSTLVLASASSTQDGHLYRARVAGQCGEATTTSARLTVQSGPVPPSFTINLANPAEITQGADVTLVVTASGTSLNYLWETSPTGSSSWSALSSINSPQLRLTNVPLSDNGRRYRVTISNSAGTLTSQIATLGVKAEPVTPTAPTVTTQPAAVSVKAPAAATFSVTVGGNPTPTVQWQTSSDNVGFTDISGANDLSYRIDPTSTGLSGRYYRAKVSNSVDTVNSQAVRLTVTDADVAPSISTQPTSQTVAVGAQATFTVAATGTPTPTIQWQVKTGSTWTNITGANSPTYTFTTTAVGTSQYRAVVTNGVNPDATSDAATLTSNSNPTPSVTGNRRISINAGWTLAAHDDGRVFVWGSEMSGGPTSSVTGTSISVITGLGGVKSFMDGGPSPSYKQSMAITGDGSVFGWGVLGTGALGTTSASRSDVLPQPTKISQWSGIAKLQRCGPDSVIALKTNGTLWIFPSSIAYAGTDPTNPIPVQITGLQDIVDFSENGTTDGSRDELLCTAVAADKNGVAYNIRLSRQGLPTLGSGLLHTTSSFAPVSIGLPPVKKVRCSGANDSSRSEITKACLALTTDGSVWAWGSNATYLLGDGTTVNSSTPKKIGGLANIVEIINTHYAAMALDGSGRIYTWGFGMFPYGASLGRSYYNRTPVALILPHMATAIYSGGYHGYTYMATLTDGSVWSWGSNYFGELGYGEAGTGKGSDTPTAIPGLNLIH